MSDPPADDDATRVLPILADLPGGGWTALDEQVIAAHGDSEEIAELFDCVGPAWPDDAVRSTAASPHYVQPPRRLLHGFGVAFDQVGAADQAVSILRERSFAECLGRSVAADFEAQEWSAELLAVDVTPTDAGMRVSFTGGDEAGIRPVHLDVSVVQVGAAVGVLWCGDTPEPFDADALASVKAAIVSRS